MNRRQFLGAALPLALAAQNRRPNVLYIVADDLGWNNVGYHGSPIRTPNLDRLAREGVQLDRFYAFPVCSPTRSALMTGRSPMRNGMIYGVVRPWDNHGLPLSEHLMPQSFQAAGYRTAMMGKWHLGHTHISQLPFSRGFDSYYGHVNGAIDYYQHVREDGLDWQRNGVSVKEEGYSTDLLAAEAARYIEKRDQQRPFFLYLPFNAPHSPLQAPPELIERYSQIRDPRQKVYSAMVDALDSGIGRVLDALRKQNLERDTIVVFHSDNGGPIPQGATNTPLRAGKATTFEGGIRVPAIVRWTGGLTGGSTSRQVMSVMDMFPTLAAACGVQPRNSLPFDGRNMWPQLQSKAAVEREAIFFAALGGGGAGMHAIIRGPWKLVRQSTPGREPADLLFHLEDDPGETKDLSGSNKDLVAELSRSIEDWKKLHPDVDVSLSARRHPGWVPPKDWAAAIVRPSQ